MKEMITLGDQLIERSPFPVGPAVWFDQLKGWRDLTDDKSPVDERSQAHGAFNIARSYRSSAAITIRIHARSDSQRETLQLVDRLASIGTNGPVEMIVHDHDGPTARTVAVRSIEPETRGRGKSATLVFDLLARDPRRYSIGDEWRTAQPARESGGLVWPVKWPAVWTGDGGSDGRITIENRGTKSSSPTYRVYGGYRGFTLTNVNTQQRVAFELDVPAGSYVEIDFSKRRATLDGQSDVTRYLTARQWWEVGAGTESVVQADYIGADSFTYFAGIVRSAW